MSNRILAAFAVALVLLPIVPPFDGAAAAAPSILPSFTTYTGPTEDSQFGINILAGEPSIGVNWKTGAVLYQHGFDTYRVTFGAGSESTWTLVSPPHTVFNVDPMLFTDSETGRTFAGGLDGYCSIMGISDDDGATWLPAGNMCVPTLDHQTIAMGPWAEPRPLHALHDRAAYYCAQFRSVTCVTSHDGGITWGAPVPVQCGTATPGFHGSLTVGANGHAWLPFRSCAGSVGVAVSTNNGLSWAPRIIPGTSFPGDGFDPDVATTPSGWAYVGYASGAGGAYVGLTKDGGATWQSWNVGQQVGIQVSTFHEMIAGDDERAAVAFIGTTEPGNPWQQGYQGVWHLYVATTYDAGATWKTIRVSEDPVQRGWICNDGTACTAGRNLLEFMDAQLDATGAIIIGHPDGCIAACAGPSGTPAQSDTAATTIVRQTGGLTLFKRFDPSSGGVVAAGGGPYTGQTGNAIQIAGLGALGTAPYTYEWSVLTRPAGSAADASSFASATSAATTFTPDVNGPFTLRFEVRDAVGGRGIDVVTVDAKAGTGGPVPPCSVAVATDPAGDTTAVAPGRGRRDVVAVTASETAATWTVCVTAANMDDAPTSGTRYVVFWTASYEPGAPSYSMGVPINVDGTVGTTALLKGYGGLSSGLLGGPASATREGHTIRFTVDRASIASPGDGAAITGLSVRVENTVTPATTYDRAPDAGGATYTFGHRVADNVAPSVVTGLQGTDPTTGGKLHLSWNAATDNVAVTEYVLRRGEAPGGPHRTIALVTGTAFTDASVADGTTYYYVVAARDGAGNIGPGSAELAITPTGPSQDVTPPTAPGALSASETTPYSVRISWGAATDADSGVAGYIVARDGVDQVVIDQSELSFVDTGLLPATTYLYEVAAVDVAGNIGPAVSLVVTTTASVVDCGQVPYLLADDVVYDATNNEARADILRVSVRETNARVIFHVGVRNLTADGSATMFRVAWKVDETREWVAYARMTDEGVTPTGLYLRSTLTNQEVRTAAVVVSAQCDTVTIGVQWRDIQDQNTLSQVSVTTTADVTGAPASQTWDYAPNTGGVTFVRGSAL